MGKITLNMTGAEFKRLIEQTDSDGVVDTLQEVFALFSGISDDETLAEYFQSLSARISTLENTSVSLGTLAFKNSASGVMTPSGTNSTSQVSLTGEEKSRMVTTKIIGVNAETLTVHDTPTLSKTTIKEVKSFNGGTAPTIVYDKDTRKVTLNVGTAASLVTKNTEVGNGLVEGDAVQVAKKNDSSTTVATGALNANGQGGEVVTKSNDGGTAAAQTFTGNQGNVTVQ